MKKKMTRKIKLKIAIFDAMVKVGLMKTQLITAALFKEAPIQKTIAALKEFGWQVKDLPKNPYL